MAGRTADTPLLNPVPGPRVTLQVKRRGVGLGGFEEHEHPRDKNGRFIRKGGTVNLPGGGTGEVTGASGGKVEVTKPDGSHVTVDPKTVEVTKTPEGQQVASEKPPAAPGLAAAIASVYGAQGAPEQVLPPIAEAPDGAAPAAKPAGLGGAIGAVYGDHGTDVGKAVDAVYGTVTPGAPDDDLTEAEQIAIKQKWKLPTGEVADLQAQLAAVVQAPTPSVTDLIDQGMDPAKAVKEAKRLARNAQVNAWRARTKLQAALDKAVKADKKGKPSGHAKVAAEGAASLPDTPAASQKLVQPPSGPPEALYDGEYGYVLPGDAAPGTLVQYSGAVKKLVSAKPTSGGMVMLTLEDPSSGDLLIKPHAADLPLITNGSSNGPGGVPIGANWFDVLLASGVKDSAAVPVRDLTIQQHHVKRGWAQIIDGQAFLVEAKPEEELGDVSARLFDAAKALHESLQHLPPESRVQTRAIAMLVAANPNDAFWNEVHKTPGAHSLATGGNGSITFWGGTAPQVQLIAHEHGHNLDAAAALSSVWLSEQPTPVLPGQTKSWAEAISADRFATSYFGGGNFQETRPGIHPIALDGKGVTTYGAVSTKEDFAESVRLYIKDRREGKLGFNPSALVAGGGSVQPDANVRFADLFPERAKVLDALFDQVSLSDLETAHKKRQKAALRDFYIGLVVDDHGPGWVSPTEDEIRAKFGLSTADYSAALDDIVDAIDAKITEKAEAQLAEAKAKAEAEAAAAKAKAAAEAAAASASVQSFEDAFAKGLIDKDQKDKLTGRRRARAFHLRKRGVPADEAMAAALAWEQQVIAEMFGAGQGGAAAPQPWQGKKIMPGIKAKHRKEAHEFVTAAGTVVHPLAQKNYAQPSQAKANLTAEIASRMNNPQDWALFVEYMATPRGADDKGHKHVAAVLKPFDEYTEQQRQDLLAAEASRRIQQWASTSGDTSSPAVVMQMAAADEFGLSAHPAPRMNVSEYEKLRDQYYVYPIGAFYRRFLRHQYEHTQEEFAKAGITHVSVYRGMRFTGGSPDWAKVDGTDKRPQLQPLNSWASSIAQARKFAKKWGVGQEAVIFSATIPVELVVGSARTGFGCLNETEFVILDADGAAKASLP